MDQFDSIKELWLSEAGTSLPEPGQIQRAVEKYHSSKKRNIYILIVLLCLCFITLILAVLFTKATLWSTTFGEALIFSGFSLTLFLKLRTLRRANENEIKSNLHFLADLQKGISKKQKINLLQLLAFFALGIGYGLFIYQEVFKDPSLLIWTYLAILAYLIFMYVVFRPFSQKISRRKAERLLEDIREIQEVS